MKSSGNREVEFNIKDFAVIPESFTIFSDEEKEKWIQEEKVVYLKNRFSSDDGDRKKYNGLIFKARQIAEIDENFAEIFNKFFSGKKILVDIYSDFNFTSEQFAKIIKINDNLKKNGNEILFYENSTVYNIDEVTQANSKLNTWVDDINSKKIDGNPLSPLEKFYLAYDKITNFEFDESDFSFDARNIISVLNGNKIVCVGYARLLSELCRRLGIECETQLVSYNSSEPNHMNCIVRIKDDKYKVDGVFYSDPCWDSLKNGSKSISHSLLTYKELPILFGSKLRIAPNKQGMNYLVVDNKFKTLKTKEEWQNVISELMVAGKDGLLDFIDNCSNSNINSDKEIIEPTSEQLREIIDLYITGVLLAKRIESKYPNDENVKNSAVNLDFYHKILIGHLVNSYTTRENLPKFKEKIAKELETYIPEVSSKTFDELRKIYDIEEQNKNKVLADKMKMNCKHLEFSQFVKLLNNLTKVSPLSKDETTENINQLMRVSLIKAITQWKRPADGINPISKLAFVYYNRRSVHQVPVLSYMDDFYDQIFVCTTKPKNNKKKKTNETNKNYVPVEPREPNNE